jgi:N-acetylneuraminate synthase
MSYVIAEIGVNHNGSVEIAKELIHAAKECGADCAKFQTFKAETLAKTDLAKAHYQQVTSGAGETQFQMLKRLELKREDFLILETECRSAGIDFMSSAFDVDEAIFLLENFNMPYFKVASGEISNGPLLFEAAKRGSKVLLSTGMSHLGDIQNALEILASGYLYPKQTPTDEFAKSAYSEARAVLQEKVTILHCVSQYPAPYEDLNLWAMKTIQEQFQIPVGYSDHSEGHHAVISALALGAQVIEKHMTLDRNLPGPDHRASLDVDEFKKFVKVIRATELSLGDGNKKPRESELPNRDLIRRSLILRKPLKAGESITENHLTSKRPGTGISPLQYWSILNRQVTKDLNADHILEESDLV